MSDRSKPSDNKYFKSMRDTMQKSLEKISPSRAKEVQRRKYAQIVREENPDWEDVPSYRGATSEEKSESSRSAEPKYSAEDPLQEASFLTDTSRIVPSQGDYDIGSSPRGELKEEPPEEPSAGPASVAKSEPRLAFRGSHMPTVWPAASENVARGRVVESGFRDQAHLRAKMESHVRHPSPAPSVRDPAMMVRKREREREVDVGDDPVALKDEVIQLHSLIETLRAQQQKILSESEVRERDFRRVEEALQGARDDAENAEQALMDSDLKCKSLRDVVDQWEKDGKPQGGVSQMVMAEFAAKSAAAAAEVVMRQMANVKPPEVIVKMEPTTQVSIDKNSSEKFRCDSRLMTMPRLNYVVGKVDSQVDLGEWKIKGRLQVTKAAPFSGPEMWDEIWEAADAGYLVLIGLGEKSSMRARLQAPIPTMSRHARACHDELAPGILASWPTFIVRYCQKQAIKRGNKDAIELADGCFLINTLFKVTKSTQRRALLDDLEKPEIVKTKDLYTFLMNLDMQVEKLIESGLIPDAYDYTGLVAVLEKASESVHQKFKLELHDFSVVNDDENPKTTMHCPKEHFDELLMFLEGQALQYYPNLGGDEKNAGPTMSQDDKAKLDCKWCKDKYLIKQQFRRRHRHEDCHRHNKEVKDKKGGLAPSVKDATVKGLEAKLAEQKAELSKLSAQMSSTTAKPGARPKVAPKPPGSPWKKKKDSEIPCKWKINKKACPRGGDCRFSHEEEVCAPNRTKECRQGKRCRYKDTEAGCMFGLHNLDGKDVHLTCLDRPVPSCSGSVVKGYAFGSSGKAGDACATSLPTNTKRTSFHDATQGDVFGSIDSAANVVAIGKEKNVVSFTGEAFDLNTSGGVVEVPEVIGDTPFGEIEGVFTGGNENLMPMHELPENAYGFSLFGEKCPVPDVMPRDGYCYLWGWDADRPGKVKGYRIKWENGKPQLPNDLPESKFNEMCVRAGTTPDRVREITVEAEAKSTQKEEDDAGADACHTHLNKSVVGMRMPCTICGGIDHWYESCASGRNLDGLVHGLMPWEMMQERSKRILMKAVLSRKLGSIEYVWSSTGAQQECPLFSGDTQVFDVELDKSFNVLMVHCLTDDVAPRGVAVRTIRLFACRPWQEYDEEFAEGHDRKTVRFQLSACKTVLMPRSEFSVEEGLKRAARVHVQAQKVVGTSVPTEKEKVREEIGKEEEKERKTLEAFMRFVDDGCMSTKDRVKTEENWKEFPYEGSGVQYPPFRYIGLFVRTLQLSATVSMLVLSQSEFVRAGVEEFYKEFPWVSKRHRNTPGPVSPTYTHERYKKDVETEPVNPEEFKPGRFAGRCKHYVLMMSYAEQGTRLDLSVAINVLQRLLDKWDESCDRRLIYMMQYLWHHWDYVLIGICDTRDVFKMQSLCLPDSSFGDDPATRKSTNGYVMFMVALHGVSIMPAGWKAVSMSWQAQATKEAEMAGILRVTKFGMGITRLAELLLNRATIEMSTRCDNMPAVRSILKGGISQDLRHCRRMGGLSQAAIADFYGCPENDLSWCDGKYYLGDPFTKIVPHLEEMLPDLGLVAEEGLRKLDGWDKAEEKTTVKSGVGGSLDAKAASMKDMKRKMRELEYKKNEDALMKIFREAGASEEEIVTGVHRVLGHKYHLEGCVDCLRGGQRRRGYPHVGDGGKEEEKLWSSDATGIIHPPSYDKMRYCHLLKDHGSGYERAVPVRSKAAVLAYGAAVEFADEVKHFPKAWSSAQDREYLGEFKESMRNQGCHDFRYVNRESPWENHEPESRVGRFKSMMRKNMSASRAPDEVWSKCARWCSDTQNLCSGSWEKLHGHKNYLRTLKNMAEFGTKCSVIREQSERDKGDVTWMPKTFEGFLSGYAPDGAVWVTFWRGSRWRDVKTQNVKIMRGKPYFVKEPKRNKKFSFPSVAATSIRGEKLTKFEALKETVSGEEEYPDGIWVECSCCNQFRHVCSNDVQAVSELPFFECGDIAVSCGDPQADLSQAKKRAPLFACLTSRFEQEIHELCSQVTQKVTRKQLWSDEKFGDTDKTWSQAGHEAVDVEKQKFHDYKAYDRTFEEWDDVLRRNPKAKRVRGVCIFYVKHWELGWSSRKLCCRFVTLGNDVYGVYGGGDTDIEIGEILYTCPPLLAEVRLFLFCALLQGHVVSCDDWRGAYLQEEIGGEEIYICLPKEFQDEDEKKMKCPVRRVRKALYGLQRAGHDFNLGSMSKLESLGWRSARHFDCCPSVFVRNLDGTAVKVLSTEEKINMFRDDE